MRVQTLFLGAVLGLLALQAPTLSRLAWADTAEPAAACKCEHCSHCKALRCKVCRCDEKCGLDKNAAGNCEAHAGKTCHLHKH